MKILQPLAMRGHLKRFQLIRIPEVYKHTNQVLSSTTFRVNQGYQISLN